MLIFFCRSFPGPLNNMRNIMAASWPRPTTNYFRRGFASRRCLKSLWHSSSARRGKPLSRSYRLDSFVDWWCCRYDMATGPWKVFGCIYEKPYRAFPSVLRKYKKQTICSWRRQTSPPRVAPPGELDETYSLSFTQAYSLHYTETWRYHSI